MSTTLRPPERSATERFAPNELRVEGRGKVSGATRYTADIALPGMLWCAFATSPFPHARIVSIDTSAAEAVPGVRAIITGPQLGPLNFGRRLFDRPVLAYDVVRFVGEHVAAVAADTPAAAEEAAALIDVEYEELPVVSNTEDALASDAPVLHPLGDSYLFSDAVRQPRTHQNIQGGRTLAKGDADLEAHFAAAHKVYEHRFTTPRQHHGYIEPHAAVVAIEDDGTVRVYSPCKAPFRLREQLAIVTGVERAKIVIETPAIGGDFGGKGIVTDEFACYFLAKQTGRPIKAISSYVDDIQTMGVRHASTVVLRTGVDKNGRFLVHHARVDYDGGAYAAGKPGPWLTPGQLGFATIPYQVPHARIEVRTIYTNTVPSGHMRAPADVQTVFAWESHVDLIARDLGIDALDFRLANVMMPGDTALTGETIHAPRAREVLEALRHEIAWDKRDRKPGIGYGIGFACRHTGGGKTSLVLRLFADGTLEALTAVPDQGSGSATVITRVASAALSIDPARIAVRRGNTAEAPNDPGAGASRVTHIVGGAAEAAGKAMRAKLEALVGLRLVEDTFVDEASGRETSFAEIAARVCADGPLEVIGKYDGTHSDPSAHPADYSFSAFGVTVNVDARTGAFQIAEATFVVDVGTIINPVSHQGQIDGGYVYGLGNALLEELPVEDGKIATLNLADYKLPSIADVPPLRTVLLHGEVSGGPFGAKMAGELSNTGIGPAIANAIDDAVGARIAVLPITAERVFNALAETHA